MVSQDNQSDAGSSTSPSFYLPPSVDTPALLSGASYTYYSPIPPSLLPPPKPEPSPNSQQQPAEPTNEPEPVGTPCALGVDEAGRGPVLGPMVYGVFFLPIPLSDPLLRETHHFDDSKALTPAVRESLMRALHVEGSDLHTSCGYAINALSARDISIGMLKPSTAATYNLNAQAMDATVELIRGVMARGVNVTEIYVDTIGSPTVYEMKLQRLFPSAKVTVAKKADSLYPSVSAASVCAKVTRDKALEVLYRATKTGGAEGENAGGDVEEGMAWGSGYPSDGKCVSWLRNNMHPVFGWGPECRFSWGTAKDMLEGKNNPKVEWPVEEDGETARLTAYFTSGSGNKEADELGAWFGTPADLQAF